MKLKKGIKHLFQAFVMYGWYVVRLEPVKQAQQLFPANINETIRPSLFV